MAGSVVPWKNQLILDFCVLIFSDVVEALLSMTWYQFLKPWYLRSVAKSVKVCIISLSLLFFIGEVSI